MSEDTDDSAGPLELAEQKAAAKKAWKEAAGAKKAWKEGTI